MNLRSRPARGQLFRGRRGILDTLYCADEPPVDVRTIREVVAWWATIEAGVEWLSVVLTPEQQAEQI